VLKFFFSTIILFIASVILIAEAAFAIPSIPGTQLMAQVNPSPNPVLTPTDRGNVDESNRNANRSSTNSQTDSQATSSNAPQDYDLEAMDKFDRELYGAGK
jgi:hypothetical protein